MHMFHKSPKGKVKIGLSILALLGSACIGAAQDRDRDRDNDKSWEWDSARNLYTRIVPNTVVPIRVNTAIDVTRRDNRVYYGTVDQDIRGTTGGSQSRAGRTRN